MLAVKKLIMKMLTDLFHNELWSGSWSSGNITVPNSENYSAFLIDMGGWTILAWKSGTDIVGTSITGTNSNGNQYSRAFYASYLGDVWSWKFAKQITHYESGNHSAVATQNITKIVGLIPNFGGGTP